MSPRESKGTLMSSETEQVGQGFRPYRTIAILAALVLIATLVVFLTGGRTAPRSTGSTAARAAAEDDALREARELLSRDADVASCSAAIGKVNSHLGKHPDLRPPAVTTEEDARLRGRFNLDPAELAEAEGASYTQLDAHHLDGCLLFRDAARALDTEEVSSDGSPIRPGPVERATTAFDWAMRQVRPDDRAAEQVPPAYALRRGRGNALERGLTFLALLEQDAGPEHLAGCLLTVPGPKGARLWACGVVVGDGKDVYLFDPRLGLPVPGPGGRGVATLAEAAKDPAVLAQLDGGPEHAYDVKPDQLRAAEGLTVFTLSSLAPRMRFLQDNLLKRSSGARLAADPADLDRLESALKASGGAGVKVSKPGIDVLWRFLPKEEGGADAPVPYPLASFPGFVRPDDPAQVPMSRVHRFEMRLVPWEVLPQQFNSVDFPVQVGLGQRVREAFAVSFTRPVRDPKAPREQMLHGHYSDAVPKLVTEHDDLQASISRRSAAENLDKDLQEWLRAAREAYVFQQRAKGNAAKEAEANQAIENLWKHAGPVAVLLLGAAAKPRDAEVIYQLGLCMQEQAEQRQARIDVLARDGVAPAKSDAERGKRAWEDAKGWWTRFATDYGQERAAPAARQNRGRAEAMLGDWKAAAASFGDLSGPMSDQEKVAALYRAREAQKQLTAKK